MCADQQEDEQAQAPMTWREGLKNAFSNWDVPLPWHIKLSLALKNAAIRAKKRSTCCGNSGEPGC